MVSEKVLYKSGQRAIINGIEMEFIEYLSPTEELWTYEAGGKECNFHRHVKL